MRDRKEFYKGETVSLSGSLSDNRDALIEANKIIKDLESEANELAESIGLDKDVILAAARGHNSSDMTSRANVPSFSAEDNANARVWFDNLLKYKDSMKWSDEQTNRVGQLALVGKASKWVEYLTLNDSGSLATLDEFKKAFLERFDKTQSVLEAQRLISNLRQSSDEDVQDFFERVSTCVMLSFKESIIDMKKEFAGGHIACIEKATKLMCEQIIKRLFISGLRTEIRQQVESNLSSCKDNQELLKCALTAEVSLSNPATRSLSEIAEINSLRQELAAMRMATAGAPQNRRPVGNWSQNRARLGASAGGSLPSSSRPSAPPPPGQSDPNVPNFRQRIALRRDWIYCDKCGQWGKHKGNECRHSQAKINSLRRQDPRNPPTTRLCDSQYDNSLYTLNISAGGWRDPSATSAGPPSTPAQGAVSKN